MKNHITKANVGEVWCQSGTALGCIITWMIVSREGKYVTAICIDVSGNEYMHKMLLLTKQKFSQRFIQISDSHVTWTKI